MVFWGIEVKSGEPFHYLPSGGEGSQLHISQATLGLESKPKERISLSVQVGENPEVLVCSLTNGGVDSCGLDLIFDEESIFTVKGGSNSGSIHLTGYYMPVSEEHHCHSDEEGDEYEVDSMEEDGFDSEEFDSEDYDSEEEEDEELAMPRNSGVIIEEVEEEEEDKAAPEAVPLLTEGHAKDLKKKKKEKKKKPQLTKTEGVEEAEEDEDGFVVGAGKRPGGAALAAEENPKKKQAVNGSKSAVSPDTASAAQKLAPAQHKEPTSTNGTTPPQQQAAKAEPKKQKAKAPVAAVTPAEAPKPKAEKEEKKAAAAPKAEDKTKKAAKAAKPVVRTFPNGLEVHEVSLGKANGKQATPGKRVFMHYTGRLKSSGKQFDSSVGKKPFAFRLGVGEVIKGWDVGVQGMRVGDKRKLVIPPQMAYGSEGIKGTIPGNAWLLFDVELIDVK